MTLGNHAVVSGAALRFAVKMRAGAAGEQAQAIAQGGKRTEGIRNAALEPTDHAGTQARQDHAAFPCIF